MAKFINSRDVPLFSTTIQYCWKLLRQQYYSGIDPIGHIAKYNINIDEFVVNNGLHKEVIYVKVLYCTLNLHSIIRYSADIAKFKIIQTDGKTGVAINFCDEYGNIKDSPCYDTNNYCNV